LNVLSGISIGLVGPLPPPSGGMANQTRQLARLLEEAGVRVELVQVNPPYPAGWVERLRGVRALVRLLPYLGRLWRCAGRVDLFHVMANSGWAWHLFAAPAIRIGRLRGCPVVVNYRGGEAETFLARESRSVRATLASAALLVVPSGFLKSVFARFGIAAEIVPNIVDLSRFSPAPALPGRCHVIVTRNLEALYDIPTALRAFSRLLERFPVARLTIAGSGPERSALEALCTELGLAQAVTFTGRLDNEQTAGLYRSADLVLNPSTADNMPNSLLEAMASGVPIVSTNVGGVPFMVVDGTTALLVPARDPDAMAAAAERALSDRALASRLREAGRAEVERYTWSAVRPILFDAYSRALGGAVPHAPSPSDRRDRAGRGG
jgi:glycosyltransferase involved in cell wall biosynthesis